MTRIHTCLLFTLFSILMLPACGGGGGGNPPTSDNTMSGNASLASLTLSAGALDQPVFDPDLLDRTATVGFLTVSVQVTAVPENPAASVTVAGLAVSGDDNTSSPVALSATGTTEIAIVVTAEDGTTTRRYTITVTRESEQAFAQRACLKGSNTGSGDLFGTSVALSGDTLAAGAHREDSGLTGPTGNRARDAGAVYVFDQPGLIAPLQLC